MSSESDYSDLTDDSEELRGSGSKSKGRAKKRSGKGEYRIRKALRAPRATNYSTQSLHDQIHGGDIDLEPEYQRDVVWPEHKQIGVIDSIIRNFYLPPVIFAVKSYDDGAEMRTCIDGKQRLTSIYRFMDGLIPHRDPFTNEKLWYKASPTAKGAKGRKLLPEKYRKIFSNKQITCVEYVDLNDSDEREIFQRVQLGMALTPAEKLQVTASPRATFIRSLQAIYLAPSSPAAPSLANIEMDRTRGSDFRNIAHALHVLQRYDESPKGKARAPKNLGTLPQLEKWLTASDEVPKSFQDQVHSIFSVFVKLATKDGKEAFDFKKLAPIEFVVMPLLISLFIEKNMGTKEMGATIRRMREELRAEHVDIRMNDRVGKSLLDFITEVRNGDGGGSGSGGGGSGSGSRSGSKADDALKRKRNDRLGPDDDDYEIRKTSRRTTNNSFGAALLLPSVATPSSGTKPQVPKPPVTASTPSTSLPTSMGLSDRLAAIKAAKANDVAGQVATPPHIAPIRTPTIRGNGGLLPPTPSPYNGLAADINRERERDKTREKDRDNGYVPRSPYDNRNESPRDLDREWERLERERAREREKERQLERERISDSGWGRRGGRVGGA